MNDITQDDVVYIDEGDGPGEEGVGAESSTLAAAAGFAANAESEGKGVAERETVTRVKRGVGGANSTVVRVRSGVVDRDESSQQTALNFEAAPSCGAQD